VLGTGSESHEARLLGAPDERAREAEVWGEASLERAGELDLIASLGIRTLRMPLLWRRVAPDGLFCPDWRWADERLDRMRALGIKPVLTLVQPGAVPPLDASFAEGLAEFAAAAAERYPWVTLWTPVHAPLSLALQQAGERSRLKALCALLEGTVLAMHAVRDVNAAARLVQTEEFRATHATPALRWQAELDDELRWLSLDVLTGRFERNAALQAALVRESIEREALRFFLERPCVPDVLAIDYALERERLLDERVDRYPLSARSGDVADVEAVRAAGDGLAGHLGALRLTWHRYELPLALTGACTHAAREEQLRWLDEAFRAAAQAQAESIDVRALSIGPLFGERGAFDVRGELPRQTALAYELRARIEGAAPSRHPALESPGWWQRESRLTFPAVGTLSREDSRLLPVRVTGRRRSSRPLLITGAPGSLATALGEACQERCLSWVATTRAELDPGDVESIARALERYEPWAVVNAAGFTRLDAAEGLPALCHRENAVAPALLAMHCARSRLPYVTFSTDLVFDGRGGRAYVEGDRTNPLSVYGRAKSAGERHVLREHPKALVVRAGALFGGPGERDFAARVLSALERGQPFEAASDHVVSPSYVPDLAHAVLDLLFDRARGVWHLTNRGHLTCEELARELASRAGHDAKQVLGVSSARLHLALRPRSSVLASRNGDLLPSLSSALARFAQARGAKVPLRRAA